MNNAAATPTVMIQGTTSDAGKSVLVAALCRVFHRRGVRVAPFKPQNMALNSAVTPEGGEIGRAQAVQAAACGLTPHTDMNPVLLKPNSDVGCQVILCGRVLGNRDARLYHEQKPRLLAEVLAAHGRLARRSEVIVVEGAGSPAEINLRDRDIANMGFAEAVDCPVLLVADIDRGGVFAHLVGTLALLSPTERARVQGFIINRFRGDIALLEPGLRWLEQETGKPVLGVLPYLHGLFIEAEDSFFPQQLAPADGGERPFRVIAPAFPRISNHTDFDPLRLHPGVDFQFIGPDRPIPPADLIILPGSKSVLADLAWLRRQGWEGAIQRHLRYGGRLMGICGGYQMLGERLADPHGVEGPPGGGAGLGLLPLTTCFSGEKRLVVNQGRLAFGAQAPVRGYEIHMGHTAGPALARPAMILEEGPHGAVSADGQVLGGYLHGLFDEPRGCAALLAWAGLEDAPPVDVTARREADLERLADAFSAHVDLPRLAQLCGLPWG